MKKIIAAALSVLFLSAGCFTETPKAGTPVKVYILAGSESRTALDEVTLYCPEGEDVPLFAAESALNGAGRAPFPGRVKSFSVNNGTASVLVSGEAASLTGYSLTLAKACIVLTLTELEGIENVELTVEGQSTASLAASDFVRGALVLAGTERNIALFFADSEGENAVQDTRILVVRETDTTDWYLRYMLEEMIAGPRKGGLLPVLPEGTRLLSVFIEGGVCSVNFSGEFVNGVREGAVSHLLTLECLILSVTAQPGVTHLRLLADGQILENYGGIDTSEPLTMSELTR
jgi:germination protein M